MEEYNNEVLQTVEQAANDAGDFSMDIAVSSEINKTSESISHLERNIAETFGESSINPNNIDSLNTDLELHSLSNTNQTPEEHVFQHVKEARLSLESQLEKMHCGVSGSVDRVNITTNSISENLERQMDWTDSVTEESTPAKDFLDDNFVNTDDHVTTNSSTIRLSEKCNLESTEAIAEPEKSNMDSTDITKGKDDMEKNVGKVIGNVKSTDIVETSSTSEYDLNREDNSINKTSLFMSLDQSGGKTNLNKNVKDIDVAVANSEKDGNNVQFDAHEAIGESEVSRTNENKNTADSVIPSSKEQERQEKNIGPTTTEAIGKNMEGDQELVSSNNQIINKSCEGGHSNIAEESIIENSTTYKENEEKHGEKIDPVNIVDELSSSLDTLESLNNQVSQGANEEICIIPDTEREISQEEKDAASSIPPLRDLTQASTSVSQSESISMEQEQSTNTSIFVYKCEKDDLQLCNECKLKRKVMFNYMTDGRKKYLCDENCLNIFKSTQDEKVVMHWEECGLRVKNFSGVSKEPPSLSFIRKCASCSKITNDIENNLTWEIMDFCNELCLTKYQKEIGSRCSSCKNEVTSNSLGKYCVRFGNDIRQFCTSVCLEKYKKGLKVCSYCQQDMSGGPTGFLAPVGDKGQFKDFCSQVCMEKYDIMTNVRPPKVAPGTICSVCKAVKPITIEFELDGASNYFCGEPCFVAFSFVNKISPGKCGMCRRYFSKSVLEKYTMYYDNVQQSFCSNSCKNIYIIALREIVPCSWCKVIKYNFDMIRRYSKTGPMLNMCSVNCLSLYRQSVEAVGSRKAVCGFCQKLNTAMYHLTMSDGSVRNFCTYNCVMNFQNQYPKQSFSVNSLSTAEFPVPTGGPRKCKKTTATDTATTTGDVSLMPVISSVHSLASTNGNLPPTSVMPPTLTPITTRSTRSKTTSTSQTVLNSSAQVINSFSDIPVQVQIKQHFIVRAAPMPEQRNVSTMCYTKKAHKATTIKPIMVDQEVQTDEREASKILIPVPVPIYVPTPMHMYSTPTPIPVPIPVPIPIPIFIPTTRNSAAGIMKEIKKIQVKIPTDPYEAELLMMAEMVAEEKKEDLTDSESDVDDTGGPEDSYSPEPVDASNTFGDDMLQMALKMATELDEPAVDLEGALTANTITAPQGAEGHGQEESVDDPQPMHHHMMDRSPSVRGRKRGMRQARGGAAKRGRRMSHQVDMPMMQHHQVQQPPPPPEPAEKPDANMCLKYTFGVNAWKQWVTTKNAELEKSSRRVKLFNTEILQLTSDELNYSLCLFVKEVRKPNGAEYAPDTIYYLCLGIQQYLFENGRIDNIFCDPYYEKFTDCLDEVAKKFSVLYNDSHYIVTRVEEEHLWESKQLGAHSPHVLLSTLMFFNTKHFNLTSVDEHMQLSFSHIMKHWKRNPNQPGASKVPGSRNVLLRFYPPQSAIQNNARKKKVYEQQENEENPLRCPVKLYEFYLSKCPESVKTRNDVFYLQPERSCVPDSPVWYSTMPLPKEALEKMLHRVKMVKEINVALLTS